MMKKQSYLRIDQQILKGVQAVIPGPVRNRERLFIDNQDEAGRIALGGEIKPAICAARRHQYERTGRNKASTNVVNVVDVLAATK
jgi:hypothetical protein